MPTPKRNENSFLLRSTGKDSSSITNANIKALKDINAERKTGTPKPNLCASTPPVNGPKTKPRPKAAPIIPIPLERFFISVISEIYAIAAPMLAEKKPAIALDMKSKAIDLNTPLSTKPRTIYDNTFPLKLKIIIGFLP